MASGVRVRAARVVTSWSPEERDAVLYSASALFAICTAQLSNITLYQQWGRLATVPYLLGALASAVLARRARRRQQAVAAVAAMRSRVAFGQNGAGGGDGYGADANGSGRFGDGGWHWTTPRMSIFLLVLVGATLLPLSLEVLWRTDGNGAAHVQPEVSVVEQSGNRVLHGQDPYQLIDGSKTRPVVPAGQPAYDAYDPYLPLMSVLGIARSTHAPPRLTDARVAFSIITIFVVILALSLCRGPTGPRLLTLQAMTVLPTAALPLATGGDDVPVAALLLLGLVLMQRRRPLAAGVTIGLAASMKITAWPLALVAVFGARDRSGRTGRRPSAVLAVGMLGVMAAAILPSAAANIPAFVDNVVRFPLGLAGISSPAASPLIGHLVVSSFPHLHRAFPVAVAAVGGVVLLWVLVKRTPRRPASIAYLLAWTMTVAILLAPATRVGYFIYPADLFVWTWLLRSEETAEAAPDAFRQLSPEISNNRTAVSVTPPGAAETPGTDDAKEVGATVSPSSHS